MKPASAHTKNAAPACPGAAFSQAVVVGVIIAVVGLGGVGEAGRLTSASGRVIDAATGAPVRGATVVVESDLYAGSTPPPAGSAPMATTRADGSFVVAALRSSTIGDWTWSYIGAAIGPTTSAQWIEVFPPAGDAHVTYHGLWSVPPRRSIKLGTIALIVPTQRENAWLAMLNRDRASIGVPNRRTPLIFDQVTLLAARRWAQYMAANGWYGHDCPTSGRHTACISTWQWEINHHGYPSAQNIVYRFGSWMAAERAFMAGKAKCLGRGDWQTCAYGEQTGHYINTMAASTWVGLGEARGKDPAVLRRTATTYYDQEFAGSALPGEGARR